MKHFWTKRRLWAAAIVVVTLAGGGWAWHRHRNKADPDRRPDNQAEVSRGDLDTHFKEVGDISAKSTVPVTSKVSGRIIKLSVREGDRVSAGQDLAVIQPGRTETERYLPSTVTAPISGIVMRPVKEGGGDSRFVEVGDYVSGLFESPTAPPLATIADLRQLVVRLKISEMDILKLREHMPVTVSIDALQNSTFTASVSMIAPQAEKEMNGGKIFRVEVSLTQTDPRLRSGMTARVDALLEHKSNTLKAPLAAVFEDAGETLSYLVVPGSKPRQVRVTQGLRTDTETEILSGLKEKDKVLTEKPKESVPLPELKPGEKKPEAGAQFTTAVSASKSAK